MVPPTVAESSEPTRTPTFASSPRWEPKPNASSPTKSATVNPIPATKPMPTRSAHLRGDMETPGKRVARKENRSTPRGLPRNRPNRTPRVTGSASTEVRPSQPPTSVPAEKKAKIGTATRVANTPHLSAKAEAIESYSGVPSGSTATWTRVCFVATAGTVNPSKTPATVAWMPEAWIRPQVSTASGIRIHQARMPF